MSPVSGLRRRKSTSPQLFMDELPASQYPNVGFQWMNNYMLTKRWRTSTTGDSELTMKLLKEFEEFCRDTNGDLKEFWNSSQESLKAAMENSRTEISDSTKTAPTLPESTAEAELSQQKTEKSVEGEMVERPVH